MTDPVPPNRESSPPRIRRAPAKNDQAAPSPSDTSGDRSRSTRRKPQAAPDPGFVAVGRILAPFGLKGEVKVQSLTDNERRLAGKSRVFAGTTPVTIADSREAGGYLYLRFRGYPDRTSVEPLRHAMLQVRESDLPPLPEGEYYRFQLLGLEALDREGTTLGSVAEVVETGANDVLRITGRDGKDVLVPLLADTLVSVDLDNRQIVLDPPEWR